MLTNTFSHIPGIGVKTEKTLWDLSIFDWETRKQWEQDGAEDVAVKANREWKCRLDEAPETMLDTEIEKDLVKFIEKIA